MNSTEKEDLTKVEVKVAICTTCNGFIKMAVKKGIDKATKLEFYDLEEIGCELKTVNVLEARVMDMCERKKGCLGVKN